MSDCNNPLWTHRTDISRNGQVFPGSGTPNWVTLSTQALQCHGGPCCLGATPAWSILLCTYCMSWRSSGNRTNTRDQPNYWSSPGILSDTLHRHPGVGQDVKRDLGHLCHAARVVCKGKIVLRDLLPLFPQARTPGTERDISTDREPGCLLNWAFSRAKMLIYQVNAVRGVTHLPWTIHSNFRRCSNFLEAIFWGWGALMRSRMRKVGDTVGGKLLLINNVIE